MDIAILGAGIVGLTVANLLARNSSLQITLIDPQPPTLTWDPAKYDLRCSAITPAAKNILDHIGVWEEIVVTRVGMYDRMLVWDQELHNKIDFTAASVGEFCLGYIVENRVITRVLYNQLQHLSNVTIVHAPVNKIQTTEDSIDVHLTNRVITCKLVLGADGSNSWVRKQAQIPTYCWDYKHSALVATIVTELPHGNVAMQRFMPDGPLAFLPLAAPNLCSIVWSSDPARIHELMQLPAEEFATQLSAAFAFKLGTVQLDGERACFPLRMIHSAKYIAPRCALLGDAAHVVHPMAGQGLNLGILDAAVLDEILQEAYAAQQDLGAVKILRKYELRRKPHNTGMIALLESLKQVFASDHAGFTMLRAHGLRVLNSSKLAKNAMLRFAMGLNGDLPMAARNG